MQNHDVIAIGTSAGGVEALLHLAAELRPDIPAALFVVIHLPEGIRSELPSLLSGAGPLPATHAADGEAFRRGRIYVAPPGAHLLLSDGRMRLNRGPRENRARPAVDPLFRTAGICCGSRVIGVVLTGALYDGTAGLRAIKRCGGIAIVQDPDEAAFPEMPLNALRHVAVDHRVALAELPGLLAFLAEEPAGPAVEPPDDLRMEAEMSLRAGLGQGAMDRLGHRSVFSCPECHGTMWEIRDGDLQRYRCHVGHAYSAGDLLAAQSDAVSQALWSALRAHEDRTEMLRRLSERAREGNRSRSADLWDDRVREYEEEGRVLRELLSSRPPPSDLDAAE